jgi:hypothetical protein
VDRWKNILKKKFDKAKVNQNYLFPKIEKLRLLDHLDKIVRQIQNLKKKKIQIKKCKNLFQVVLLF